jgi:predicted nucleic acid-binding protein
MIVVIDVSGVMEILLHREKTDKFYKTLQNAVLVITPDLYVSELANTLWKYHKAKTLSKEQCSLYMQQGLRMINSFVNANEIWEEAFSEGINNNHSVYDMFYMVAARRHSGTLITKDSTLAAICKKNHVDVCF